jgi:hypothetical protein
MYFFYVDESGSRDPDVRGTRKDGSVFDKDPLYVLTAVSLFEKQWFHFEREITNVKLEMADDLKRVKKLEFGLADCEVKSTWLRIKKVRDEKSAFLKELGADSIKKLSDVFFRQLTDRHMTAFTVVVDKRFLHGKFDHHKLHQKAYELLLERIEYYLDECHPKHHGIIVMDDTDKTINRELSMKHARFQREGGQHQRFDHIVEYPFFTDSRLSNGVQLADLCGYNVYRAFRDKDFKYSYFEKIIQYFYCSKRTIPEKLDGLKVYPPESDLVQFAKAGWTSFKTNQPTLF